MPETRKMRKSSPESPILHEKVSSENASKEPPSLRVLADGESSGCMCQSKPTSTARLDQTRSKNKGSLSIRRHQIRRQRRNPPLHRPPNPRLPPLRKRIPRSQWPIHFRQQPRIRFTIRFLRRSSFSESICMELWPAACQRGGYRDSLQD